jgi:hypothetical protein
MSIRAFPNSFSLSDVLHSCKEAPAVRSGGLLGDTAPYGTALKVPFKCRAGLAFKGFVGNLRVAGFLQTNCEERVFGNVYDGRINMLFKQVCGLNRDACFGIGKSKLVEGVSEGLSAPSIV